jgi:hypothetical protein
VEHKILIHQSSAANAAQLLGKPQLKRIRRIGYTDVTVTNTTEEEAEDGVPCLQEL